MWEYGQAYEIDHDRYLGLGVAIAVFHRLNGNLSIKKITTTQPGLSIYFDLSLALCIHFWARKIATGEEKNKNKGLESRGREEENPNSLRPCPIVLHLKNLTGFLQEGCVTLIAQLQNPLREKA